MPRAGDRLRAAVSTSDAALAAALAVALAVLAVAETLATSDTAPGLRAAMAAATVLGLAVRTTYPGLTCVWIAVGVMAETLVVDSPDVVGVLLAVIVAAYSGFAHAPVRRALPAVAVLAASALTSVALDSSGTEDDLLATLLLFFVVPCGLGWGVRARSERIRLLERERLVIEREAATAAATAAAAERQRIARELHDVVSHAVTLVAVQAEAGQAVLDTDPAAARRALTAIGAASRDALTKLHRMLGLLDDSPEVGGLARLPGLVEGARAAGLALAVSTTGVARPLPEDVDRCAFRVLQEGVTNVLRHAGEPGAELRVAHSDAAVEVVVLSTGRRAHLSAYGGAGRGLQGLRERVETLGGHLWSGPIGDGFELGARLPTAAGGRG
ncbi:sensor histidine kinase [Nocardioides sp. CFH 31398]|uniref:sensor histidine kinase n=1 Tax=Nocardioides sp. CFH 31398 TaxID=2919579 RepID=UPI001F05DB48|nr:histidine kinase [Nocardioides sp. CFH 31398]MCH1865880.1 histidine kinase [Nocardioides sp. CFH 31398]